ncbi:MAG: AAA family ATPase [Candidatus Omnitrophota bacterium]
MYQNYWGLKEKPFENIADARFTYSSPQHEESIARLLYAVREGKGLALVSGVFGCGKTFLSCVLLKELEKEAYHGAIILDPQMEHVELLMAITKALGVQDLPTKRSDVLTNVVLDAFCQVVLNNTQDGKKTVVVIDEAHTIEDPAVWEALRLLLNFRHESASFSLIFMGQPEIREKVYANKALLQRIEIRCHLGPFSEAQTREYVCHRLRVAGRDAPVFLEDTFPLIYTKSGGIPRRINTLCDLALLTGFEKYLKLLDSSCIEEAARELEA